MTQEDKDLLLKDICARLPYRIRCHFKYGSAEGDITLSCIDNNIARFEYGWYGRFHVDIDADYIKPYLRPMSSMTEKELTQYKCMNDALDENYEVHIDNAYPAFDWLNANHFDYRGLIEKGLALEAPKDMYNLNKK